MSTESKKYRSEMRAKANRLGNSKSPEKVDASSWTPGKPLNADKKTGARPLRARIYKAGGRVQGDRAPQNAGKTPRANGGASKAEKAYSDQNEGKVSFKERMSPWNEKEYDKSAGNPKNLRKPEKANGGALSVHNTVDENKEKKGSFHDGGFKKGGKAEKACGGGRMAKGGRTYPNPKERGEAQERRTEKLGKLDDAIAKKQSKNLFESMKPSAETDNTAKADEYMKLKQEKAKGGKVAEAVTGMLKKADIPGDTKVKIGPYKAAKKAVHKHDEQKHKGEPPTKLKKGGEAEDSMGGRVERAKGGRTKGKTNINIIIGSGAGGGQQQQPNMPPPGAPVRPPPPPQNAPPPPMMGGPPPGPPPGGPPPLPPGGPPGMPPGPPPGMQAGMRAAGGRVAGYRSKDAGAGSGLGRLRKVHAAGQHTPGFKGA